MYQYQQYLYSLYKGNKWKLLYWTDKIKNIKLEILCMIIVDSNNMNEPQLNDNITEI